MAKAFDRPPLPLDVNDRYDEEPCKVGLAAIDEELRAEFEGQRFEPEGASRKGSGGGGESQLPEPKGPAGGKPALD